MSTAATPAVGNKPTLTTAQMKSYKTLPENWREVALASPKTATGVRAIAAAFAAIVDGESFIPATNDVTGKTNVSATIADIKYGSGYHSRERAQFIIDNSPAVTRDVFHGIETRKLLTVYEELKVKRNLGKHEEPLNVDRPKGTATVFELKFELYELLSNDDLERVLKFALARLHPDNKETGDETKYKRIGELWGKIKDVQGV